MNPKIVGIGVIAVMIITLGSVAYQIYHAPQSGRPIFKITDIREDFGKARFDIFNVGTEDAEPFAVLYEHYNSISSGIEPKSIEVDALPVYQNATVTIDDSDFLFTRQRDGFILIYENGYHVFWSSTDLTDPFIIHV